MERAAAVALNRQRGSGKFEKEERDPLELKMEIVILRNDPLEPKLQI